MNMLVISAMLAGVPAPTVPECTPEHAKMGHCELAVPASAQPPAETASQADPRCPPEHAAMGHCTPAPPEGTAAQSAPPPPAPARTRARTGPEHAADTIWGMDAMDPVRRAIYAEHGGFHGNRILIDRVEYRATSDGDGYAWEGEAWFGGDIDRLWLKTSGEGEFGGALNNGEAQAMFSRAVGPWFNLQGGIRHDFGQVPSRTHLAVGVQGLAPYWFDIDAAAFLSTEGELTARVEAEYDQRLTNQLILQPRFEVNLSAQDIPERRIGAGLTNFEAGMRLRYEIIPEFAPYLGVEWEGAVGRTASLARARNAELGGWAFVAGIRAWF